MKAGTQWAIAVVVTVISVLLAWPYHRDFEYWAESRLMWNLYFIVGSILLLYVMMAFIRALHILLHHDHHHADDAASLEHGGDRE